MKKLLSLLVAIMTIMAFCVPAVTAVAEAAPAGQDLNFVIVPKCVHAWFDEVNKGRGFAGRYALQGAWRQSEH